MALSRGRPKVARHAIWSFVHRLDEAYCRGSDSGEDDQGTTNDDQEDDDSKKVLPPPCRPPVPKVRDPNDRQVGHDDESSVMVSDTAYLLLRLNAAYLFSHL
jgi:hypothetical protein